MVTTDFTGTPESFDSRDAIERMRELEADEDSPGLDEDEAEELKALRELEEAGIEDWQYGAHFIHEDHFEDHARELAEDIGAVSSDAGWPVNCIDWDEAATALKQDYTSVEFNGATYYVR